MCEVPLPCRRSRAVMPSDSRHLFTIITDTHLTDYCCYHHCLHLVTLLAARVEGPFTTLCESLSCTSLCSALPCLPAIFPTRLARLINATPHLSSDHAACPPPTITDKTSSCDQSTALPLSSLSRS
jgi:hypothetical protein